MKASCATSAPLRLFSPHDLFQLIVPLVIEQVLAVSVGMADTVMIASAGEAAVSGISLVDTINFLLIQVFASLATGGAVVVAQYIGHKDHAQAGKAAKQLIHTSLTMGIAIMSVSLALNKPLLAWIFGSIEPAVMDSASTYLAFTALSFPFLAMYNAGAALLRSMGNSRLSMHVSIAMNLMNITGNALLIYLLGWGVAGAGTATLVSRAIAALIMMRMLTGQRDAIRIDSLWTIKPDWQIIKKILHIGIPSGIEGSLFQVGKILVQSLVATFGTAALAANAVASSIAGFLNIPGTAIGLATITVVGQCVGAGDTDQAAYFTKRLMGTTFILLAVVTAVLFLLMPHLVGLFGLGFEVTELSSRLLRTFFFVNMVFWPLSFSLPQALRAAGDARFTMTASIASMWIFRIGLSYLLGSVFGFGLAGVWYAMYVDWIVRSCCFVTRFVRGSWKHKRVI